MLHNNIGRAEVFYSFLFHGCNTKLLHIGIWTSVQRCITNNPTHYVRIATCCKLTFYKHGNSMKLSAYIRQS
jgi:hypothetical protein